MTILILAQYFTAGIVLEDDSVVRAAPIIRFMIGWPRQRVVDYCNKNAWKYAS